VSVEFYPAQNYQQLVEFGGTRLVLLVLPAEYVNIVAESAYIFYMITNQMFMYTEALGDVHAYVNAAIASCNYVEPAPTASKSIIY
jgi:hypothetical protein